MFGQNLRIGLGMYLDYAQDVYDFGPFATAYNLDQRRRKMNQEMARRRRKRAAYLKRRRERVAAESRKLSKLDVYVFDVTGEDIVRNQDRRVREAQNLMYHDLYEDHAEAVASAYRSFRKQRTGWRWDPDYADEQTMLDAKWVVRETYKDEYSLWEYEEEVAESYDDQSLLRWLWEGR